MVSRGTSALSPGLRIQRLGRRRSRSNLVGEDNAYLPHLPWYCVQTEAPSLTAEVTRMARNKPLPTKEIIVVRKDGESRNSNLTALFSSSNVPGLREISSSDHISRKIFWFIAFLLLGFLALSDIHQLLAEFYSYPITVDLRLRESRKLPFPAVTVCNLNIVRYSALCNLTSNISIPIELKEKLCGLGTGSKNSSFSDISDINDISSAATPASTQNVETSSMPTTMHSVDELTRKKRQNQWKNQNPSQGQKGKGGGAAKGQGAGKGPGPTNSPENGYAADEIELTEREEKELQENLTTWLAVMANVDKNLTFLLGHQFEDMILRCTMKSNNCTDPRNFKSSFTPTEGNCFTYTSMTYGGRRGSKRPKPVETSLAGVDHGLELVLNLEVNEYLPGTAQIGALVMIHLPDDFGTTASEAIFVAPETTSYIGMKMVQITRLPSPYPEHCVHFWPKEMLGSLTQNSTYSQQACLKICLQRTIQKKCRCQSAMLPQLDFNKNDPRICDTRKKNTRKCVEEVMLKPESKIEVCQCPPRCQVVQYEKTVSLAKWPTREDRVSFDRGKTNVNFQNAAKVVVYYQTMTLQEVTQKSAWSTAKLFSSLGGFMGMYVGFSFLSLVEVFEVLTRRVWYALTRKPKFKDVAKTIGKTITYTQRLKRKRDLDSRQDI